MSMKENDKITFEVFSVDNGYIIRAVECQKTFISHSQQTLVDIIREVVNNPPHIYENANKV